MDMEEKSVKNDVIPEFLKFLDSKNSVFSDQALRGFQFRLVKTELKKSKKTKRTLKQGPYGKE